MYFCVLVAQDYKRRMEDMRKWLEAEMQVWRSDREHLRRKFSITEEEKQEVKE